MTKVQFYHPEQIDDSLIQFVVSAARYDEKWLFSRHRDRSTWDMPGGHREAGETLPEAARRELWEETGALDAQISPVCVYSVTKGSETSYGMLFYAWVTALGSLPSDYEMEELLLADRLPGSLTYPDIQPELFLCIQGWLNTQSSAGEIWDVYDENRVRTGKTHRRGDPLASGEFHLIVHVWMQNSRGEYLLTRRSPNKGFPNMWESTGGSALAGDDSLTAAIREVREETGLILKPERGRLLFSDRRNDYFRDVWLFRQDFTLEDIVLQPGETTAAMYASPARIMELVKQEEFVPYDYVSEFLQLTSCLQDL